MTKQVEAGAYSYRVDESSTLYALRYTCFSTYPRELWKPADAAKSTPWFRTKCALLQIPANPTKNGERGGGYCKLRPPATPFQE